MKKKVAGAVLMAVLVRVAVLAGAGDALDHWVDKMEAEGRAVSATFNIELGPFGAENGTIDTEPLVALLSEESEAPAQEKPTFMLVEVTPAPEPSESPVAVPQPTAEVRATDLSSSAQVHNNTSYDIDFDALAAETPELNPDASGPQVLIFHTHSSEAYTPEQPDIYEASDPYRTEDKNYSVIRVGDVLAEKLESFGISVVHDREIYDYPSYTGSYNRSGAAVEQYLAQYPSIRVVIDLHRDALGSGDVVYKTDANLNGRSSAQVMLLVGTGENGLAHPHWRENLKLALCLQNAMNRNYPGLARPVEVVSERYNQQLSTGMMILEVGSNGNTLREALTAVSFFGEAVGPELAKLLAVGG